MNQDELLAEQFEAHRTRLRAVAYRMLSSVTEADDAVQEAWLRLNRANANEVENLGGWLTTVVARVCLDMLRSRTARREDSLDVHDYDPISTLYGVRVEQSDERLEVTVARGSEKRVHDLALDGAIGIGCGARRLHPAAGPARQLPCRGRGAPQDRGDLVEGHREHVVQNERKPFGGSQCVEYDEQGDAERVGEQGLVLGVTRVLVSDDRVVIVHIQGVLTPRRA